MNCQDIKNKLELYLDNELSVQEKAEIEAHLLICADCAKQLAKLKSLDSLGKLDIFPEPSVLYWKELRLNIMNDLKSADKRSIDLAALLQKFKRYIFPPKLSFRLAGLVATAVIVFFIIHISFLRQGKFELPQTIEIEDSVASHEQEAQSIQTKHEKKHDAPVPQEVPETIS
ncbi:MAG TPA: zf-HC2 domain-containing protein, partial [bacterium]